MVSNLNQPPTIGAVVIGRNEGQRLINCFDSFQNQLDIIVYVDSGSTDASVSAALKRGVEVVNLDMSLPFTAARARNAGFDRLLTNYPTVKFVQFIDGDCKLLDGWVSFALNFIQNNPEVALVCGRRKEQFPEKSIYNWLCDFEWNTPVGESKACGGDVLIRVDAFKSVNGFLPSLIAGEEPELCVRLRSLGWKIWRLDKEMTLHDAAMTKFSQWWKRNVRAGYAFAEGAFLHGKPPERHWVEESRRILIWGLVIPIISIVLGIFNWKYGLIIALIYPLQVFRLWIKNKKSSNPRPLLYSTFNVLGKFAEMYGQLRFYYSRFLGRAERIIEYK